MLLFKLKIKTKLEILFFSAVKHERGLFIVTNKVRAQNSNSVFSISLCLYSLIENSHEILPLRTWRLHVMETDFTWPGIAALWSITFLDFY